MASRIQSLKHHAACRNRSSFNARSPRVARFLLASQPTHTTTSPSRQHLVQSRIYFHNLSTSSTHQSQQSGQRQLHILATVVIGCGIGLIYKTYNPTTATLNDAPNFVERIPEVTVESQDAQVWKGMVHPALDLAAATAKLKAEETSTKFLTKQKTSATRFDSVRVASNSPPEDERSYGVANVRGTEDWKFWGVYDGHAGWATSKVLRSSLTAYVTQSLRQARKIDSTLSPETIDNAIKSGFIKLDNEIINDGLKALNDAATHSEALSRIAPARAGSCALLALFDPANATLRIACTGDSRAVLGRLNSTTQQETQYTAEAMSLDQTGFNKKELERINNAHPDEPDAIDTTSGRLLGLAVTRAFGDHRWKWPLDAITNCRDNFYGSSPRPKYISPPYLTAEPEVTTTKIQPGDFLILATDGLWDHMTNEDAVECVRQWIERERHLAKNPHARSQHQHQYPTPAPSRPSSPIPTPTSDPSSKAQDTEQTADKQKFNYWYKATPEHFIVEDNNAATHLARNALGGSRRELFCSVMSTQAPDSRNVRDDVTVQVVFFGDVLK